MPGTRATSQHDYVFKTTASPIGRLKLVASESGLSAILWENDNPRRVRLNIVREQPKHPILRETAAQLRDYFARKRRHFDLPLDLVGTEFQKKVWTALLAIPFGETRTYGEIARQLGHPNAMRAVGAANGRNPLAVVTPCHRLIGSTGRLHGFAGGLEAKAYLLNLENPEIIRVAR